MAALNMLRIFRKSNGDANAPAVGHFGIAPGVKASIHKDGVVFLHSSKGAVFSANRVGATIWQGVCDGRTVDEISCAISREFAAPPDAVRHDTTAFIADLVSQGILDRPMR